jgi:hypothetical protein
MTRTDALTFAKNLYAAYQAADIEHLFRGAPEPVKADYCYRHGWIIFGSHAFNNEDLTGVPYDSNQGGWAWV